MSIEHDQIINDLFTTAIETTTWAKTSVYKWSTDGGTTPDLRGFHATVTDVYAEDDDTAYEVNRTAILRGLRLAYEHRNAFSPYVKKALADLTFGNDDEVDFDADVADIVLQYALLGTVAYG